MTDSFYELPVIGFFESVSDVFDIFYVVVETFIRFKLLSDVMDMEYNRSFFR